jgi:hypothetical protein
VTDSHDRFVFDGDGTEAHPPLFLRDVFVALPLQLAAQRFALIYYVMTRDILRPLRPTMFTLTLSGLSRSTRGRIYDPLNDVHGETLITYTNGKLSVNLAATDSPQLLFLDES